MEIFEAFLFEFDILTLIEIFIKDEAQTALFEDPVRTAQ